MKEYSFLIYRFSPVGILMYTINTESDASKSIKLIKEQYKPLLSGYIPAEVFFSYNDLPFFYVSSKKIVNIYQHFVCVLLTNEINKNILEIN